MSTVAAPLSLKLKTAARGVLGVMRRPSYAALALVSGFLFSGLIPLLLKLDVVRLFLFELPIPLSERMLVLRDLFMEVYISYPLDEAIGALLLSYLFGVVVSMVVYILRNKNNEKVPGKSSGIGVMFGAISTGCAACGTSLLAPLLSAIGITTTASALRFAFYLNLLGAVILLYSLYSLGGVARGIQQQKVLTRV